VRSTETSEIKSWLGAMAEQKIIAGDFNTQPTTTESSLMKQSFVDSWAQAKANGTATAYAGNEAGNTRNSRIDYVYYSKGATKLSLRSSQVFDTRDSSGVMPSDHRPLLTVFDVN
jgi:endonuclease/exonuclease/phosphatase family metal-dependent hydrolase